MLSDSTYLAAKMVASTIETHFENTIATAMDMGIEGISVVPPAHVIEAVIDASFWASLRHEEGHSPKISIALLPPEIAEQPLIFEHAIRLTPANLTKLAPAVERPGIHLGVWFYNSDIYVWGTTVNIAGICLVLEVVEPGLLVVKHRRIDGFGKFVNVAILKGDQIKIVDEQSTSLTDCPALLTSLLGMPLPSFLNDSVNVLVELAASMRAHGRGGLVVVVPSNSDNWKSSIVHPISYPVTPAFSGIAELMDCDPEERASITWQESFRKLIDIVGGFTAVDGATVINQKHELLAFGAKITRSDSNLHVDQIITTEPVVGGSPSRIHPTQNGGTRHLAAAQFVFDQKDAIALVASQDGRFTIFSWSPQLQMVHAHRIDILLL